MDQETQEIFAVLAQAFGAEEARRISGAYRLALSLVRSQREREREVGRNGTAEAVEAAGVS